MYVPTKYIFKLVLHGYMIEQYNCYIEPMTVYSTQSYMCVLLFNAEGTYASMCMHVCVCVCVQHINGQTIENVPKLCL